MRTMVGVILTFAGAWCGAQAAPPTSDQIKEAVVQLGDESYGVRKKAMDLLWEAGPAAETALRAVMDSGTPEVRRRAAQLLERITYRIEPGTPQQVIDLLQRYRSGDHREQSEVIKEMLKFGSKSHIYLLRLLDAGEADRRARVLEQFAYDDWRILMPLMAEGQEKIVEAILVKARSARIDSIIPHDAVFCLLTNQLERQIAETRADVETKGNAFGARRLAALYRLRDDSEGVLWAAERGQQSELIRLALMEQKRWPELLTRYTPNLQDGYNRIHGLGVMAAYQRLANRPRDFEATLGQIDEYARGPRPEQSTHAAKVLLILGQTTRAIELLVRQGHESSAAELLYARGQLGEARTLSEKAAAAETGTTFTRRAQHLQFLIRLGQFEQARTLLANLAAELVDSTDPGWLDLRLSIEASLGQKEAMERHLLDRIARNDGSYLGTAFAAVFPELGSRAETYWRFYRHRHSREHVEATLQRIRRLEERTEAESEITKLIREAVPEPAWIPPAWTEAAFENLAWLVLRFGRADLAALLFRDSNWEKAPTSARLLLADTLANAGRWEGAAAAYRQIWEGDRSAGLPYFLFGAMTVKCGRAGEGQAIMLRAHRMLLGADAARRDFHEALVERGFAAEADWEAKLRVRLSAPERFDYGGALDQAAHLAAEAGEPARAADMHERNQLRLLPITSGYRQIAAYIRMTSTIHCLRAKALLQAGDKAAAWRELELSRQTHPAHLDRAIMLIPVLVKAGETKRADELFDSLYATFEKSIQAFPESAEQRNQIAWLAARCRRRLTDARGHAEKAVALAPRNAAYLDTLAEISFQLGDREQAIRLIKKCLQLPSTNTGFYRLQLRRFEQGDPMSDPRGE